MLRFSTTLENALDLPFDVEERLAALSPKATVKGMFTSQIAKRLGPRFDELKPRLIAPPRMGYLPFVDYPVVDHHRLTIGLVERLHPDLSLAEGLRRFERSVPARFAESTLGKVMVATLRTPKAALLELPRISSMVSAAGRIVASEVGSDGVRLRYRDYSGLLDCSVLGSIEGVVLFFGRKPRIDAEIEGPRDAILTVRWE